MHIKKLNYKCLITLTISSFLIACSSPSPQNNSTNGNINSRVIENNSVSNVDQPRNRITTPNRPLREVVVIPKPEKELTKQQLFSGALESHNRVRAKHGLTPLKWSNKLAAYSQEWSDHLGGGRSCKMYHRSGRPAYGENLFISSAKVWTHEGKEVSREKNNVTIRDVVKKWADEEMYYNYNTNSCQPGQQCGHYTQIVWRNTTEVGCAVTFCPDESQNWVCSYNPPGNFIGQRPY